MQITQFTLWKRYKIAQQAKGTVQLKKSTIVAIIRTRLIKYQIGLLIKPDCQLAFHIIALEKLSKKHKHQPIVVYLTAAADDDDDDDKE